MRATLIFVALVGLLFCSLATVQITELARLADDTSNDCSLEHSLQETSSAIVRQNPEPLPKTVPTAGENERPEVRCRTVAPTYPASDFLHLLCIMRT
jgi:hypothetical protein